MTEPQFAEISAKLNVVIALLLRQLAQDADFSGKGKRKQGVGDIARYLASMGMDAKEIAPIIGAPLASVRTLLTPSQRK